MNPIPNQLISLKLLNEKDLIADRIFLVKDKNYGVGKNDIF